MIVGSVEYVLIAFLIICAISVGLTDNLLVSLVIFTAYSIVMSIIWLIIESPDLAITEAAFGAGVTSILFFITLKQVNMMKDENKKNKKEEV